MVSLCRCFSCGWRHGGECQLSSGGAVTTPSEILILVDIGIFHRK